MDLDQNTHMHPHVNWVEGTHVRSHDKAHEARGRDCGPRGARQAPPRPALPPRSPRAHLDETCEGTRFALTREVSDAFSTFMQTTLSINLFSFPALVSFSCKVVSDSVTQRIACQVLLSSRAISQTLLQIHGPLKSVRLSNHLIPCCPLFSLCLQYSQHQGHLQ